MDYMSPIRQTDADKVVRLLCENQRLLKMVSRLENQIEMYKDTCDEWKHNTRLEIKRQIRSDEKLNPYQRLKMKREKYLEVMETQRVALSERNAKIKQLGRQVYELKLKLKNLQNPE